MTDGRNPGLRVLAHQLAWLDPNDLPLIMTSAKEP